MYPVPTAIESERLILRRFHSADLPSLIRFMTTPEATRYLAFGDEIKTAAGARQLFASTLASYDSEQPLFALAVEEKVSGVFAGCCGISPLGRGEAEIFYALLPQHWRRGLATEIAQALTAHLFAETDTRQIKAFIMPGHEASKRVAEKTGFRDTGLVVNQNFSEKVHQYVLARLSVN